MQGGKVIDDLFDDQDKWTGGKTYDLAFLLLVELPDNPFFIANRHTLLPLHIVALNAWKDANSWEDAGDTKRTYALVIRDTLTELGLMTAFLTGGKDHLEKVSLTVRELFLKEEF